jgi:hypothetical protein
MLPSGHMAVVPLARVDERGQDRHADGDVLGVGLLLPASCGDEAYDLLIAGLRGWLLAHVWPTGWEARLVRTGENLR